MGDGLKVILRGETADRLSDVAKARGVEASGLLSSIIESVLQVDAEYLDTLNVVEKQYLLRRRMAMLKGQDPLGEVESINLENAEDVQPLLDVIKRFFMMGIKKIRVLVIVP
jgi:hypothetical protein